MTAPFKNMTADEADGFMATKESQRIRDVIIERVAGCDVLDIGCGRGIGVDRICPDPSKYTGIDCSEALIARARLDHPEYHFIVGDLRVAPPYAANKYDFAIIKSVLEHQESLEDALSIYNNALELADVVLVGWHTPPVYSKTEIIQVDACDLNNPLYQNHYERGSFDREDVRIEVERVEEFRLWTASRI